MVPVAMANDHKTFPAGSRQTAVADADCERFSEGAFGALLSALGDTRRRRLLGVFVEADERTLDRRTIAERLAAEEAGPETVAERLERRIEVSLHHKHLPELDEFGAVEYDPDTGVATYDPDAELERQVRAVLD